MRSFVLRNLAEKILECEIALQTCHARVILGTIPGKNFSRQLAPVIAHQILRERNAKVVVREQTSADERLQLKAWRAGPDGSCEPHIGTVKALTSDFYVLLGPDYAGKTSAMTGLAQRLEGRFVSYDDAFLGENASLISCLKREFLCRLGGGANTRCSRSFMLSLLQPIVAYLREQVMMAEPATRIVVDGYYYKILSKCLLLGLIDDDLFASWRRLPQPTLVIYLDADPETTWRRTRGKKLNPFEYYGPFPSREGFQEFQRDLATELLREIAGVPVCRIRGDTELQSVLEKIEIAIRGRNAK
jgi:thymidylate kinase